MRPDLKHAVDIYNRAKSFCLTSGFSDEIEWQRTQKFWDFTESTFLRESAWVILCAGFNERIVRKIFGHISLCFCDWESAETIVAHAPTCQATAAVAFKNARKISAIAQTARYVFDHKFEALKQRIFENPIDELQKLPFIGQVTCYHLAKNLGFAVAKPDRHLTRFSKTLGFGDAHHLCRSLAKFTGDTVDVIDVILWRYAVSGPRSVVARSTGVAD